MCFIHKSALVNVNQLKNQIMEIRRDIVERLKEWKNQESKKPILLKGARQIGKTWVMETFGRECFDYCAKFDFDRQEEL